MPQPKLSPEKEELVRELLKKGYTNLRTSREAGVATGTVSKIRNSPLVGKVQPIAPPPPPPEPKMTLGESEEKTDTEWKVSLPKTRIHTLEQLIDYCQIDLNVWAVEKFVCNKWEIGAKTGPEDNQELTVEPLFQVKAFLKKKVEVVNTRREIDALKAEALRYSPSFEGFTPKTPSKSGNLAEFSLFDHHFGSLIWGEETDGPDWDNKIAMIAWKKSLENLVERVRGYSPEKALIVLGNDQQNADNRSGSTENLTPQVMDSRYHKVYEVSKEASKWAIDKLLAEYGAAHVVIVQGNHDPLASWHLGDYLQTWYRHCPSITIDNSVPVRKYFEYGTNMILFTHGNRGKLEDYDRLMASEKPEMWGRCKWREAHTGDKHQRRVIEQRGATIRILPSLRPSCSWSYENQHVGAMRASEAYVWNKEEGLIGSATFSILKDSQ